MQGVWRCTASKTRRTMLPARRLRHRPELDLDPAIGHVWSYLPTTAALIGRSMLVRLREQHYLRPEY